MKYAHKFKHRHPVIDAINPFYATGFISWKVIIRGQQYGQVQEYREEEACMLPAMMRNMVHSKNEVCDYIMSLSDEEFNEHVRQSERRLRDSFY